MIAITSFKGAGFCESLYSNSADRLVENSSKRDFRSVAEFLETDAFTSGLAYQSMAPSNTFSCEMSVRNQWQQEKPKG
jgi:hypothetical protein